MKVIVGFKYLKSLTSQRAVREFGRYSHSENPPYSLCICYNLGDMNFIHLLARPMWLTD